MPVTSLPNSYMTYLKDVKTTGSNGGTSTTGYNTRVLNTQEGSTAFCSLSSNQFTLVAGVYEIEASCPQGNSNGNQARLRNITDSSTTLVGSTQYNSPTAYEATSSNIVGTFTIVSSKVFEIQHYVGTGSATTGFGQASSSGETEVYTIVKIKKIG